jgi:hypothetical protein
MNIYNKKHKKTFVLLQNKGFSMFLNAINNKTIVATKPYQ